jgi:hypothetical protein
VRRMLFQAGFDLSEPGRMDAADLRSFPTSWARRLAFGRDPRAMTLSGTAGRKLNRAPAVSPAGVSLSQVAQLPVT